ncbi:cytochrome P450 [Perilla frutescens var. frutescens]|nr:cytochrome P450 [Perilla frutescens var. frutescens]
MGLRPTAFQSERFLEKEKAAIDVKGHHFELLSFEIGKRGCLNCSSHLGGGHHNLDDDLVLQLETARQLRPCRHSGMVGAHGTARDRLFCRAVPRVDLLVVSAQ